MPVSRREVMFLGFAIGFTSAGALSAGFQFPSKGIGSGTFIITVRREQSLSATLNLESCMKGHLFLKDARTPDLSKPFCDTLEIPYRAENEDISRIKNGTYNGHVRTDGHLGWRIQLEGTKQSYIQIHGGRPVTTQKDSTGCILVGEAVEPQPCEPAKCNQATVSEYQHVCEMKNSAAIRNALQAAYGADTTRKIVIYVMDA